MVDLKLGYTLLDMVNWWASWPKDDPASEVRGAVNKVIQPVYTKVGGPGHVLHQHWKASVME